MYGHPRRIQSPLYQAANYIPVPCTSTKSSFSLQAHSRSELLPGRPQRNVIHRYANNLLYLHHLPLPVGRRKLSLRYCRLFFLHLQQLVFLSRLPPLSSTLALKTTQPVKNEGQTAARSYSCGLVLWCDLGSLDRSSLTYCHNESHVWSVQSLIPVVVGCKGSIWTRWYQWFHG